MELIWTELALSSLSSTLRYIRTSFGESAALNISIQIEKATVNLIAFPRMGRLFITDSKRDVRYVIVKKSRVFYFIEENKVVVFLVWDMRRNPDILSGIVKGQLENEK
jgi:plasmid stabilization system protein ParE